MYHGMPFTVLQCVNKDIIYIYIYINKNLQIECKVHTKTYMIVYDCILRNV